MFIKEHVYSHYSSVHQVLKPQVLNTLGHFINMKVCYSIVSTTS